MFAWKRWYSVIKFEIKVLALLIQSPLTPKIAKSLILFLLSYFFSPIDLIPDFIPGIGHIDDYILIPTLLIFIRKLLPPDLLSTVRYHLKNNPNEKLFQSKGPVVAGIVIVIVWIIFSFWLIHAINLFELIYK